MSNIIPDFDDLDEQTQEEYIIQAYEQLDADNRVPYEIATGDEGTIYEYEPISVENREMNFRPPAVSGPEKNNISFLVIVKFSALRFWF